MEQEPEGTNINRDYTASIITSGTAVLVRTGHTVPAREQPVTSLPVSVARKAGTAEAAKVVDTDAVVTAVIVLRLTALVEVLDSRDWIQRSGHVEVAAANVVGSCLDHLNQFLLDIPLDQFRLCVGILLHFNGCIDCDCSVHLVELVHFIANINPRK